ncbi:hypothetical protein DPMN_090599 [Dreissena polymorpha]|uniref:Uncharacterized protein n=1 Tax=Dreissena polymorpha TaxID=45954 RepID=A0A9D4KY11_DREPO|nr:hypothetical protein DPMN_090599 [Dreissena polymorpha]
MQSQNGNLGPDYECSRRMVTWDQTLNAVTEWLPWTRLSMQLRNGNLGPDSECSHKMVTLGQSLHAITEWLPETRV